MSQHDEAWLVCLPTTAQNDAKLVGLGVNIAVASNGTVSSFQIPELKVGTLDSLVAMSDDLAKVDTYVQNLTNKLAATIYELVSDKSTYRENVLINNSTSVDAYLEKFQWDKRRFNLQLPIKDIVKVISKIVSDVEKEMKDKLLAFNKSKGNLGAIERKASGSLVVRSLVDICKPEMFVLNSDYLVTLVVVVPRLQIETWKCKYERLDSCVVPGSSEQIFADNENALFTVTLFRKVVQSFKDAAREHRFIVRDYEFNAAEASASTKEVEDLKEDLAKKLKQLQNWSRVSFGEVFEAWIHLKAVRVFVEAVLRYGLPINMHTVLIKPKAEKSTKIRSELALKYGHLDKASLSTTIEDLNAPPMLIQTGDYYPYVSFTVDLKSIKNAAS